MRKMFKTIRYQKILVSNNMDKSDLPAQLKILRNNYLLIFAASVFLDGEKRCSLLNNKKIKIDDCKSIALSEIVSLWHNKKIHNNVKREFFNMGF
jgi:hypothetical protein